MSQAWEAIWDRVRFALQSRIQPATNGFCERCNTVSLRSETGRSSFQSCRFLLLLDPCVEGNEFVCLGVAVEELRCG